MGGEGGRERQDCAEGVQGSLSQTDTKHKQGRTFKFLAKRGVKKGWSNSSPVVAPSAAVITVYCTMQVAPHTHTYHRSHLLSARTRFRAKMDFTDPISKPLAVFFAPIGVCGGAAMGHDTPPPSPRSSPSHAVLVLPGDVKADGTPRFPWREFSILILIVVCDSVAFTQVFPYLGYFIMYLFNITDEREVSGCARATVLLPLHSRTRLASGFACSRPSPPFPCASPPFPLPSRVSMGWCARLASCVASCTLLPPRIGRLPLNLVFETRLCASRRPLPHAPPFPHLVHMERLL